MADSWCVMCCTQHAETTDCPGEPIVSGPERHGWRINVETPVGIEAYGVLVAPAEGCWRARILTYPNVLWLVPGGRDSLKFVGATARAAERRAIEFIERHCHERGLAMRTDTAQIEPGALGAAEGADGAGPAPRKVRFLPMLFGVVRPTEPAGTGDLSATGLFVITSFPLDAGSSVRMLLDVERNNLELAGSVRWMRRQPHLGRAPGMGVHLDTPPPGYVDYVRSL